MATRAITEAWSDAAREASVEARRASGKKALSAMSSEAAQGSHSSTAGSGETEHKFTFQDDVRPAMERLKKLGFVDKGRAFPRSNKDGGKQAIYEHPHGHTARFLQQAQPNSEKFHKPAEVVLNLKESVDHDSPRNRDLTEDVYSPDVANNIDRDAGVIRNVKILGRVSKNEGGREYSDRAIREASALYEGAQVNVDHPNRTTPNADRSLRDGWGVLRDVKLIEGEPHGDLHYLKTHPMTEQILERAARFPNTFGLSHNSFGRTSKRNGKVIVESVDGVRSVDLVRNPATNKGLFESEEPTLKTTVRKIFESLDEKLYPGRKQFLEDMMDEPIDESTYGDQPVEAAPGAGSDDQIASAFKSIIDAVLDDESLDLKGKMAKIKDILAAQDKLTGEAPASTDTTTTDDSGKDASTMESVQKETDKRLKELQESVDTLTTERDELRGRTAARELLESLKREPTAIRVNALMTTKGDANRKALVESWPAIVEGAPRPTRSAPLIESTDDDSDLPTGEKFLTALTR